MNSDGTYKSLKAAWIPLGALALAFFVEMVDNTLLSIALPTIGRDLGGSTTALQWVTGAYSLVFGGLLLTAGSVADRFGRRRVLLTGLSLFGLISLLVLCVSSIGELIALRAVLGIAAAMMAPITNSLVFRLFKSKKLRMRAITVMMIVGMSGFILGPLIAGSVLEHISWEWLLIVNAPIALLAWLGVRFGVAKDKKQNLTRDKIDGLGALLSVGIVGLGCYAATAGADYGWVSPMTLGAIGGTVVSLLLFIGHESTTSEPMIDLALFRNNTIRGASIAQVGSSLAMAGLLFALTLHFQYAYGWSPVKAGLANLPLIITMLAATPITEGLVRRYGHRIACLIGAVFLSGSVAGIGLLDANGYLPIALLMITFTVGLRTIMTTCAVALVDEIPGNRTSLGTALNDSAQEIGTSIGTAIIGTMIAVLVTKILPSGVWSPELVSSYFHGEQIGFLILSIVSGIIGLYGASTLSNSRVVED